MRVCRAQERVVRCLNKLPERSIANDWLEKPDVGEGICFKGVGNIRKKLGYSRPSGKLVMIAQQPTPIALAMLWMPVLGWMVLARKFMPLRMTTLLREDKYAPGDTSRWKHVSARFPVLYQALLDEPD